MNNANKFAIFANNNLRWKIEKTISAMINYSIPKSLKHILRFEIIYAGSNKAILKWNDNPIFDKTWKIILNYPSKASSIPSSNSILSLPTAANGESFSQDTSISSAFSTNHSHHRTSWKAISKTSDSQSNINLTVTVKPINNSKNLTSQIINLKRQLSDAEKKQKYTNKMIYLLLKVIQHKDNNIAALKTELETSKVNTNIKYKDINEKELSEGWRSGSSVDPYQFIQNKKAINRRDEEKENYNSYKRENSGFYHSENNRELYYRQGSTENKWKDSVKKPRKFIQRTNSWRSSNKLFSISKRSNSARKQLLMYNNQEETDDEVKLFLEFERKAQQEYLDDRLDFGNLRGHDDLEKRNLTNVLNNELINKKASAKKVYSKVFINNII